ncbi:DivIVA domain-containing protein [soil metagenome]
MAIDGARLYRVFENLDELVSTVETARGVLVSGSCVVPRGHVLDLLDDLREAIPAEMEDAHEILEQRAHILDSAEDEARATLEGARAEAASRLAGAQDEAEQLLAQVRGQAESMVAAARTEAAALAQQGRTEYERAVAAGRAEHDRQVSATEVHRSAHQRSEALLAETSASAEAMVTEASTRAERLRTETDEYVESRLADFAATLTRMLRSVEAGRGTLRVRQAGADADPPPGEFYDQDAG